MKKNKNRTFAQEVAKTAVVTHAPTQVHESKKPKLIDKALRSAEREDN